MISLIAAISKNNAIGKNGKIPWQIKGEQEQFKRLTTNNIVIMGRKTYEEIGRPLEKRENIIISKTKNFQGKNIKTATSLEEALNLCKNEKKEIFIAGGSNLFEKALKIVSIAYITTIDVYVEDADAFFPSSYKENFVLLKSFSENSNNIKYTRNIYIKKFSFVT